MVADHSKFDKRSFMKIEDLTFAKTVITNLEIPVAYRNYYEAVEVHVITADN